MTSILDNRPAKILWAVDAFHEKPQTQLRCFEAITKLFGKVPLSVQLVAMLKLGRYNPEKLEFQEKWHDLAESAQKRLHVLTKQIKHPALLPPRLIKLEGSSTAASAKEFLKFSLEEGAQLLVVSSHGRKGLDRYLLGSFAESLVLQSPIPVLVVNPNSKAKSVPRLKNILFPTDFSEGSYKAFARTVLLARALSLPVRLFHKVEYFYPEVAPAFFYPAVSGESVKEFRDSVKAEAEPWIRYGTKYGVKVSFELNNSSGRTLDEILAMAKKLGPATMIAVASQSNKAEALLLGSLTRQLLRTATCPVFVVHPNEESIVKRFVDEAKLFGYNYSARPFFF